MPVLTLLDALAIQSYIFASNRLQDVAAGSLLVEWAMDRWVREYAQPLGGRVLMSAGGNALVRFPDLAAARTFAAQYSRKVLEQAPGLEVAIVHQEFVDGHLAQALAAVHDRMQRHKPERYPGIPLLGLAVTARCRETRLPASDMIRDDDGWVPVSEAINARREALKQPEGAERWRSWLPESFRCGQGPEVRVDFPARLDWVVRGEGSSLMGVVHVDGNGVGQRIIAWREEVVRGGLPDAMVEQQVEEWSDDLRRHAEEALRALIDRLLAAVDFDPRARRYVLLLENGAAPLPLHTDDKTGTLYLPLRPILLGGDDLTFVCDGRIALALAELALETLSGRTVRHLPGSLQACAGVAFLRYKAPFARGYALSADLCTHAKRWLRENKLDDCSALDWHIARTGLVDDIAAWREQEYQVSGYQLTCRPYPLRTAGTRRGWDWLTRTVLGTAAESSGFRSRLWRDRRHKVRALAEVARKGREAVERSLLVWRQSEPGLSLPEGMEPNGFFGRATALLDAAELLDLYLPLGRREPASG